MSEMETGLMWLEVGQVSCYFSNSNKPSCFIDDGDSLGRISVSILKEEPNATSYFSSRG